MSKSAIVIGSGISGLLSCVILKKSGYDVICFEFDKSEDRKSIQQRHHVHTCMGYFSRFLDEHIPDFKKEFYENGGLKLDWGTQIKNETNGYTFKNFNDNNLYSYFGTRNLIEKCIRKCVNIEIKYEKVIHLCWDNNKVIGVKTKKNTYSSNLVIDARGAHCKPFPNIPKPLYEENMISPVHYYSRMYSSDDTSKMSWMNRRLGKDMMYIFPVENKKFLVSYGGIHKIDGSVDEHLSKSYYKNMFKLINKWTPVGDWKHGFQKKWWLRHHEKVEGYITIGDRNIRVVPVYGTGMTMCAKQVTLLYESLKYDSPSKYFKENIFKLLKKNWITYQGLQLNSSIYKGNLIKRKNTLDILKRKLILNAVQYDTKLSNIMMGMANYLDEYKIEFKNWFGIKAYFILFYWYIYAFFFKT